MKILTLNRLLALAAAGVLAFAVLVVSPLGAGADLTNTGNYNSRAYANGGFDEVSSIKFDPHRIFSEV